jgi:hypothetical protein
MISVIAGLFGVGIRGCGVVVSSGCRPHFFVSRYRSFLLIRPAGASSAAKKKIARSK